jgi:hypothetical protein
MTRQPSPKRNFFFLTPQSYSGPLPEDAARRLTNC